MALNPSKTEYFFDMSPIKRYGSLGYISFYCARSFTFGIGIKKAELFLFRLPQFF